MISDHSKKPFWYYKEFCLMSQASKDKDLSPSRRSNPVLHRATYNKRRVLMIAACIAALAFLLSTPLLKIDCTEQYNFIFGYYTAVRIFLSLANIFSMAFTYSKISKKLHKLHLKRVFLMDAASASKYRDQRNKRRSSDEHESGGNDVTPVPETEDAEATLRVNKVPLSEKISIASLVNSFRRVSRNAKTRFSKSDEMNDPSALPQNFPAYLRERKRRRQEKRMTIVMFSATVCFTTLVLPQCINGLLEYVFLESWIFNQRNCYKWLESLSVCLFNLHFSVNFFIYLIVNTSFRNRIKRMIKLKMHEENPNSEGRVLQVSREKENDNNARSRLKVSHVTFIPIQGQQGQSQSNDDDIIELSTCKVNQGRCPSIIETEEII
ncbi:uncharacterized protein LOC142346304 isoform X2 [Convolutriloba macropyga]|uniref:uncharacterized protein LOC142346304 isoform X2 n=1 Tax=Convolutriloba macropyga TaxID=536237 RepID=UPI003F524696